MYWNEAEIGAALHKKISAKIVQRNDLFVTNKIWCTFSDLDLIESNCELSLKKLGLDYMDMCLLHLPSKFSYRGEKVTFPIYTEPKIPFE